MCQQTQQTCPRAAIPFQVQHLSGYTDTLRKRVPCYHHRSVFFPLNSRFQCFYSDWKAADTGTGRNSHTIVLSAFSPSSSLLYAFVSSAASLKSSSQQILSVFFSCLLLSSSCLMGQKTNKYLAKGWCCIFTASPFCSPTKHKAAQGDIWKAATEQKDRNTGIYPKATFKRLLGRGGVGRGKRRGYCCS